MSDTPDDEINMTGPPQEMYKFLRDHMPVMAVDQR